MRWRLPRARPDAEADAAKTPATRRRIHAVTAAGVGVLVVAVIAALALLRPPQTLDQRKPPPTELTVPVERRALTSTVVTRGTVGSVGDVPVSCLPSSAGGDATVFTRRPEAGAQVAEGGLLAAVNGRPVLALQGETPAFRTMLPGAKGADVAQLQAGLKRLGHTITDAEGVLGPSTRQAVSRWYAEVGFAANEPAPEASAALRAARDQVAQAESQVETARRALRTAQAGPARSAVLASESALAQAREAVRAATTDAERAAATRQLQLAQAQDKELRAIDLGEPRAAVAAAEQALARAQEDHAALVASTGVSVPFCEVVFLPTMPVRVVQVRDTTAAGQAAEGADPGAGASEAWVRVASGELRLLAEVSTAETALISAGAQVRFRTDAQTSERTGTVTAVSAAEGRARVEIAPEEAFDAAEQGQGMRVAIEVGATEGEVLVVPLAAVSGSANGLARVQRRGPNGRTDIEVRAGLVADGYVEIAPVDPGTLDAGDEVVVGG
ncbi:MAG: hypothetical protein QM708_05800 [Propioniciclava sp.]|uniref:peptidoglycan-binding protein n=1 Tax=Propioniciclava sp. TaxID=2038686 RepID=UPI0039E44892